MKQQIFTIGHSNLPLEQFVGLLTQHRIEALVDIRRFPSSRKYPHFNEKNLAEALHEVGIVYHWMEALGGRRLKRKGFVSPNEGLENESFRNYADYMMTEQFRDAAEELVAIAGRKRTAVMCAEKRLLALPPAAGQRFPLGPRGRCPAHVPLGRSSTASADTGGHVRSWAGDLPGGAEITLGIAEPTIRIGHDRRRYQAATRIETLSPLWRAARSG